MSKRFWAPQRATVMPDQVVLALLESGGDAAGDLGNALLAMHRAGAASCESVAKGAVPSEQGLVTALATTRAALAGPAVDTVSKSLEANYAGLLVRDVFDDAEQSALDLYRTCVSKGVAPPLAASRVGAVYGVPSKELGRYATLACDPRVNPVALTDAADRTLLGYVSKLVEQEAGEVKEEVSKAPTGHAREFGDSSTGWDEREHPREATSGRFTHAGTGTKKPVATGADFSTIRLPDIQIPDILPSEEPGLLARLRSRAGLGGQTAPAVGTTPAEQRERMKPRQRQMRADQMRQVKAAPKPVEREPKTGVKGQVRGQVRGRVSGKVSAELRSKVAAAMQPVKVSAELKAANQGAKIQSRSVPAARKTSRDWTGTAIERVAGAGDYPRLDTKGDAVAWTMMQSESAALRRTMPEIDAEALPGNEAPRLVRAHALQKSTTDAGPSLLDIYDPSTSRDASAAREHASQAAMLDLDAAGYNAPLQSKLGADDPIRGSFSEEMLARRRKLAETVAIDANDNYRTDLEREAFAASRVLRDYASPDEHWAVVPVADSNGEYNIPAVDEYVVADEIRGQIEGGHRNVHLEVDPNQAFVVSSEPEQFYDGDHHVIINRWMLTPVEEDELEILADPSVSRLFDGKFGKALDPHEAVRFEQKHPRDEDGQFVSVAQRTSGIAPLQVPSRYETSLAEQTEAPARPKPKPRQMRSSNMRQVRQLRAEPAQAASLERAARPAGGVRGGVRGRVRGKVQAQPVGRVQAVLTALMLQDQAKDMPVLDDRSNYKLLTKAEFDDIRARIAGGSHERLPVYGEALQILRSKSEINGTQVVSEMNLNLEAEIINNEGEATKGYVWQRRPIAKGPLATEADDIAMGERIRSIFESNPTIAQIHIEYGEYQGQYQLYANREPVQEQVLIEMDPEIDLEGPVELVELGPYRSMEMMHRRDDLDGALVAITGETPFAPINAKMHQFRLQNARVRRYRLQNED